MHEELIFRGVLLPALARVVPWPVAVLGQALAFGIPHGRRQGGFNVLHASQASAVGVGFGIVGQLLDGLGLFLSHHLLNSLEGIQRAWAKLRGLASRGSSRRRRR